MPARTRRPAPGCLKCLLRRANQQLWLAPLATPLQLLTPVVEGVLQADMQRFAEYAVQHRASTKA